MRQARLDDGGGIELIFNPRDIIVEKANKKVSKLGSKKYNYHLCFIEYEDNALYFNMSHSICGAYGTMFWLKTTLYEYFTDKYGEIEDKVDIKMVDSKVEDIETAYPDASTLPTDEPLRTKFMEGCYLPIKDYIKFYLKPGERQAFYQIEISKDPLLKLSKSSDGSPNSIITSFLLKALARAYSPKEAAQVSVNVVNNYTKELGIEGTHRDLVRHLRIAIDRQVIENSPIEKLNTYVRGLMYLHMQPEEGYETFRHLTEYREAIDAQHGFKEKCKYAKDNSICELLGN